MSGKLKFCLYLICLLILQQDAVYPQIVFREPKSVVTEPSELDYIEKSDSRKKIVLNGDWKIFREKGDEKSSVRVPSGFIKGGEFIYEKEFQLSKNDIASSTFQLHLLGVNYSAEISVNSSIIYKHGGGEFPFSVVLARDLLHFEKPNKLSIRVSSLLDSRNTIPLKQRYLNPVPAFGIFRDVYLLQIPAVSINRTYFKYKVTADGKKVNTVSGIKISNNSFAKDSIFGGSQYSVKMRIVNSATGEQSEASSGQITIVRGKEVTATLSLEVQNVKFWSPVQPDVYSIHYELYNGANKIDDFSNSVSFYQLASAKKGITLNGAPFMLQGVTYIPSSSSSLGMPDYEDYASDLKIIKETGFNAIRIPMVLPHPYILSVCEQIGLFVFHELPLNAVPAELLEEPDYRNRIKNYLHQYIKGYSAYGAMCVIGFGTGYIGNDAATTAFLGELTTIVKKSTNWLTSASFIPADTEFPSTIDFYGVEFAGVPLRKMEETYTTLQAKYGKGKIFISEAGYLSNLRGGSGYTTPNSYEAQAKYFQDFLTFFEKGEHAGWFLHTMFDYRASYHSIISGYDEDKLISYGILGESRKKETRLAYKVILSKMLNLERVTIPIGIKKHEGPMDFIIAGILMAFLTGIMVNSGRKFREEALRALMRPYNFFSDVRDHRMISGVQTFLLAVNVAGIMSIVCMSVLHDLKDSVLFEKFLLSFGSDNFVNIMSYLMRHPLEGMLTITVLILVKFLILTISIRLFSFFVINKVYLSHAYYIAIWSFIPVLLLIPVSIVLYQLMNQNAYDIYFYWALGAFFFWIILRMLKGVYVIYDASPGKVYGYGFLIIMGVAASVVLYYQLNDSALFFIMRAIAESKVV